MLRALAVLAWSAVLGSPVQAQDRPDVERQFRDWLERSIWPRAQAAEVSRDTFDEAFAGIALDWDLPDLSLPGAPTDGPQPQHQAEFGSPADYFRPGSLDAAASIGREMAERHAETLDAVEAATGVPGRIVLAVWGRESGYGRAELPHDAFAVLGTRGFMGTRADAFAEELVAALEIAEAGPVAPRAMSSSWAGALGQPQFMPSSVLEFAVDGDGDGRADIWGSEADTLASIGNYLGRNGWVAGRDWGFEVTVPSSLSCAEEGPDQGRLIMEWEALGLARVNGRAFPEHERLGEAYLLMPAGRTGPAFLVTPNFYVLKDYNMSDLYALFVGHLGDRIAYGAGDFVAGWTDAEEVPRSEVAALQRGLEALGHDVGGADGLPGFRTRRSIGRWQEGNGQASTCYPEPGMLDHLAR